MAWTYTTLKASIHNWTENDGTEFAAELDNLIMLAEDRILREADLDKYRRFCRTNLTLGERFLTKPDDFLIDRWMVYINLDNERVHLQAKDNSFVSEYWPNIDIYDLPKFYSDWDDRAFVIAPTPDFAYVVELAYTYRPAGLSSSVPTTWVSTNAPRALFSACMVEAGLFNKMDISEIDVWERYYDRALKGLVQEQMTRQRNSENDVGEIG